MSKKTFGPDRLAEYLADRFSGRRESEQHRRFKEMLLLLSGGRKDAVREYYVRKYRKLLLTVPVLLLVLAAAVAASALRDRRVSGGRLERPGYLEGAREEQLMVLAEGESEALPVTVTVSGRRFSKRQLRALFRSAEKELDAVLPGSNPGVDEVRESLILPDSFADGAVQAGYVMIPYGMIGEDGRILGKPDESGTLVELQVHLTCQEEHIDVLRTVRVLPRELTGREAILESVHESVQEADETEIEEAYLTLPGTTGGRGLHWQYPKEPWVRMALATLILLPLLLWYLDDSRVQERAKERERQLVLDYGDLMWKMTMLSGAGLTIRAVFFRIAAEYTEEKPADVRYVYEEIVRTCREMKSGVPEAAAYENFGRRCGQQSYIRLGSLLAQNLKKGTKGLTEILEKEAMRAMDERRSNAREAGERAGTRLLMPMILLLGVVLIALTLPCVMAF